MNHCELSPFGSTSINSTKTRQWASTENTPKVLHYYPFHHLLCWGSNWQLVAAAHRSMMHFTQIKGWSKKQLLIFFFLQYPTEETLMAVDCRVDLFASFNPAIMSNTEQGGQTRCRDTFVHALIDLLKVHSNMKPKTTLVGKWQIPGNEQLDLSCQINTQGHWIGCWLITANVFTVRSLIGCLVQINPLQKHANVRNLQIVCVVSLLSYKIKDSQNCEAQSTRLSIVLLLVVISQSTLNTKTQDTVLHISRITIWRYIISLSIVNKHP